MKWIIDRINRLKPHFTPKGFTFIELIVVIGILSVLFSIAFVGISSLQVGSTKQSTSVVLYSDLKNQQIKAMSGDTQSSGIKSNYGIKILSDSYVLFRGSTYNALDTSNITMDAEPGYTINSTFPDTTIVFEAGSGEIIGFVNGQNTITITHTSTGQAKTIQLNKYGAVTSFN